MTDETGHDSQKDFIPGIYNHCDRWCERCFFTSRCAVYEDTKDDAPEQQDIHNKAFWDNLANNFAKTIELLHQAAESFGIDLDKMSDEEQQEIDQRRQELHDKTEDHELSKISKQYSKIALQWLQEKPGIEQHQQELVRNVEMGTMTDTQAKAEVLATRDCLEVIEWYCHFIHVKIMRAVRGKLSDHWMEEDDYQTDFNGSARIALLAIDRSLQAWAKLYEQMPSREDDFLKVLAMLQKIKAMTEREFPDAFRFRHPFYESPS